MHVGTWSMVFLHPYLVTYCRYLRPDDKQIVAEVQTLVQQGTLARVKSMNPNAGPLSPKLARRISMRPSCTINTGTVFARSVGLLRAC